MHNNRGDSVSYCIHHIWCWLVLLALNRLLELASTFLLGSQWRPRVSCWCIVSSTPVFMCVVSSHRLSCGQSGFAQVCVSGNTVSNHGSVYLCSALLVLVSVPFCESSRYWPMCLFTLAPMMPDRSVHVVQRQQIWPSVGWKGPFLQVFQDWVNHFGWVPSFSRWFIYAARHSWGAVGFFYPIVWIVSGPGTVQPFIAVTLGCLPLWWKLLFVLGDLQ